VAAKNEVRYASRNDERERMLWVEARQPDGSFRRYQSTRRTPGSVEDREVRVFDCVDCHNRATHIYELPEDALDQALAVGRLDRSLPFVRKVSLKALLGSYPDGEAGAEGLANALRGFYRRLDPDLAASRMDDIDAAIAVLQGIYARNIHHGMNITWGSYPSHLGHRADGGCFRCHGADLEDAEGRRISDECTLCHSLLAYDEADPFAYLQEPPEKGPTKDQHTYLRDEFLEGGL
jgi:hypothetical protein